MPKTKDNTGRSSTTSSRTHRVSKPQAKPFEAKRDSVVSKAEVQRDARAAQWRKEVMMRKYAAREVVMFCLITGLAVLAVSLAIWK